LENDTCRIISCNAFLSLVAHKIVVANCQENPRLFIEADDETIGTLSPDGGIKVVNSIADNLSPQSGVDAKENEWPDLSAAALLKPKKGQKLSQQSVKELAEAVANLTTTTYINAHGGNTGVAEKYLQEAKKASTDHKLLEELMGGPSFQSDENESYSSTASSKSKVKTTPATQVTQMATFNNGPWGSGSATKLFQNAPATPASIEKKEDLDVVDPKIVNKDNIVYHQFWNPICHEFDPRRFHHPEGDGYRCPFPGLW
jgi:hypothetical protein